MDEPRSPEDDASYVKRTNARLRALGSTSNVNPDADPEAVRERLRRSRSIQLERPDLDDQD